MVKTSQTADQLSVNFDEIKVLMSKQAQEANGADATMGHIQSNTSGLNRLIEDQTASVNISSSVVGEMTANIASVTRTLVENEKNVITKSSGEVLALFEAIDSGVKTVSGHE